MTILQQLHRKYSKLWMALEAESAAQFEGVGLLCQQFCAFGVDKTAALRGY